MELPVPTKVPPHDPLYHFHDAPVPKEPPLTAIFVLLPTQIVGVPAVAPVGFVEGVFTWTVTCAQVVVPHSPSARKK
jgi:hypothetical protein